MLLVKSNNAEILARLVFFAALAVDCRAQADTTPPKLVAFSLNPAIVNLSKGPVIARGRMEVIDDLSGLTWAAFDLSPDHQTQLIWAENVRITRVGKTGFVVDFDILFSQYVASGTYVVRLQLQDASNNLMVWRSEEMRAAGFLSTVTVINQSTYIPSPALAIIPHLATGEGWQTTVRASGACVEGCTVDVSTYNNNGVAIDTTMFELPASPLRWAKSIIVPETAKLATGWVEVKVTSKAIVGICASALFTNTISKQEASSSSSCVQPSGWESAALGAMQYFYGHQSGYTSGVALLNKATGVLAARLEWRDQDDTVVASRTVSLLPRQQISFTSNEAVGKYGRFSVLPDPGMTAAQKDQFKASVYSLGFQFSPFGTFTQLSVID
jgi:hypothetical protein